MIIASDLHFGKEDEQGIQKLLDELQHDEDKLLICPGDFTTVGKEDPYKLAAAFVQKVLDLGVKIVATPGNHDFGGSWNGEILKTDEDARLRMKDLLEPLFKQDIIVASEPDGFDSISQVGNHVFVSLRSTHKGNTTTVLGPRIKKKQIKWCTEHLKNLLSTNNNLRVHLVTHHSIWKDSDDKHLPMDRRRRLEDDLLQPFGFVSIISGHNHRFIFSNTTAPKHGYRILRIGAPTVSTRNESKFERGFLKWKLSDIGSDVMPTIVQW
mmetsp:Transcript_15167/g.21168  ORF Transcript_15167/g.21168 Transcript_15167/m.21168 type:complete len:267 (-) Transcript_15167:39-839(-)